MPREVLIKTRPRALGMSDPIMESQRFPRNPKNFLNSLLLDLLSLDLFCLDLLFLIVSVFVGSVVIASVFVGSVVVESVVLVSLFLRLCNRKVTFEILDPPAFQKLAFSECFKQFVFVFV